MIPFGEFLPDQTALENPGATVAKNVIPMLRGYAPLNSLAEYSGAADAYIRGATAAKDAAQATYVYAGNETKLYVVSGTGSISLTDVSKSGGYSTDANDRWRFVTYGTSLLATNFSDPIQKITIGSTPFADMGGSPPKAKYMAVVRDQVFTGFLDEGGTVYPSRVRWSGIGNEENWGSDPATGADFQDIYDFGAVMGVAGGEYATILMEHGIVRAQFVGPPLFYSIDKVETARGCKYPGSVASVGRYVFYCSPDGFYLFDGSTSQPIGAEKINRFFFNDLNEDYSHRISSSVDPTKQLLVVSYPSFRSANGTPDRLLIYNYALQRWSMAEVSADFISSFAVPGYSLEDLGTVYASLDSVPAPLDSGIWAGGQFLFGGGVNNKLAIFSGAKLDATIETGEFAMSTGRRSMLRAIMPHSTGATSVTVQVGSRSRQQDTATFGAESSLNDDGFCPVRAEGRFHRVRVNLTGDWQNALGIDVVGGRMGGR